jgi:hypothetical protein
MSIIPEFPDFKGVELGDREFLNNVFRRYRPQASEYTFTNLFIWRSYYGFEWSVYKDWVLVSCRESGGDVCGIGPVGPPSRKDVTLMFLDWMKEKNARKGARIERADATLAAELESSGDIRSEPARDHFDYVYLREELVRLAGNRYRSKRNYINRLLRSYSFSYDHLQDKDIQECFDLQEKWCMEKRCEDDMDLIGEWEAVKQSLINFHALKVHGGVIKIGGRVVAFTIGELLNPETAVVHIEKADPEIPGLYPVINQQFCERSWKDITYINREQDLGIPGLREAKLSYYPHHFVEKYSIRLI